MAIYGASRKKLTATSCWARRSEVGLASDSPGMARREAQHGIFAMMPGRLARQGG
jgi:hypothetical protein